MGYMACVVLTPYVFRRCCTPLSSSAAVLGARLLQATATRAIQVGGQEWGVRLP